MTVSRRFNNCNDNNNTLFDEELTNWQPWADVDMWINYKSNNNRTLQKNPNWQEADQLAYMYNYSQ